MDFSMYTVETLSAFFTVGLVFNIIGGIIMFIATFVRGSSLSPRDVNEYIKFNQSRLMYIKSYSNPTATILKNFEIFFPMYTFIMSLCFVYFLKKYKGLYGLINGRVFIDKYSIIPIVKYKMVKMNK